VIFEKPTTIENVLDTSHIHCHSPRNIFRLKHTGDVINDFTNNKKYKIND